MLNLITLKEMKHQYGEKELFQMMVRRARGAQEVLDNVGADEAREFITSPQPEIFSVDENATSETLSELAFGILGINDGERVADLCCGSGAFLSHAARRNPVLGFVSTLIRTNPEPSVRPCRAAGTISSITA